MRDPESGQFCVHEVEKLGPTTLVTTSTRRLPPQLDTRVFTLEVPDDQVQIAHALRAQAALELTGGGDEPPAALVAFQSYLQALAPWDVVVPFAEPARGTARGAAGRDARGARLHPPAVARQSLRRAPSRPS